MPRKISIPKAEYERLKNECPELTDEEIAKRLGTSSQALSRAKKRWEKKGKLRIVSKATAITIANNSALSDLNTLSDITQEVKRLISSEYLNFLKLMEAIPKKALKKLDELDNQQLTALIGVYINGKIKQTTEK